jgi:hypothetical protein
MRSYDDVLAVVGLLSSFRYPWFISGGWAIDLFVGTNTREHHDLEVGVYRQHQRDLHSHFAAWELCKAVQGPDGGSWVPWEDGEWLQLPVHQILARRTGVGLHECEFLLEEVDGGEWRFRRNQQITRPSTEISMRSVSGIPIVVPEIQLLFKARAHRPKDDHDFETVLPLLNPRQRAWLKAALQFHHPDDPWLSAL